MTDKDPASLDDEVFPRGRALPRQSPLFWAAEKDRYLRQLLIRDIESATSRRLIVYFANCESSAPAAQIHPSDDQYFAELLGSGPAVPTDLMLETNGGSTDATEKLVALLRTRAPDLRVIVPRRAKSNGTLLAHAANEILMGVASELGPIDPIIDVSGEMRVPAHVLLDDKVEPMFRRAAADAINQTKTLAKTLLQTGMLKSLQADALSKIVSKLASRDHFHSHGSVIDADEAIKLGLNVTHLTPDDVLWQYFWLLRCMYAHDLQAGGNLKIFEGNVISNMLRSADPSSAARG